MALLTRNRLPLLKQVLESLAPQMQDGDEVCILDTGSDDGTRDWLGRLAGLLPGSTVPLCWEFAEGQRLEFASARNRLVEMAKGSVVAFLDDDCVPESLWAAELRAAFGQSPSPVAVGGLALAPESLQFPSWWVEEIHWTVGLSGPDLVSGKPGVAPSTSNLAVRRDELLKHPFGEVGTGFHSPGQGGAYGGMREDADWWLKFRLRGQRGVVASGCRVRHHIPGNRLTLSYILQRSELDGRADWNRRGCEELAQQAVSDVSGLLLRCWTGRGSLADRAWLARQRGLLDQAGRDRGAGLYRKALLRALVHRVRQSVVRRGWSLVRSGRRLLGVEPPIVAGRVPHHPKTLLVAAPGYVGDTILLQPALRALAQRRQDLGLRTIVWVRWPELLGTLPAGVTVVGGLESEMSEGSRRILEGADRVLVPYFPYGSESLWRRLAPRGITFDWDVGFGRLSDYLRAQMRLTKDPLLHEVDNLRRLLEVALPEGETLANLEPWNLGPVPPTTPQSEGGAEWTMEFPESTVLLFPQTAHPFKNWPVDCWVQLTLELIRRWEIPVRIVGSPGALDCGLEVWNRAKAQSGEALGHLGYLEPSPDMTILVSRIAHSGLVISGCTGPKHIAHGAGVPTVTLYGRTEPHRWGSYFPSDRHLAVVSPGSDLTDRELAGYPADHVMSLITVEQVVSALQSWSHWKPVAKSIAVPGFMGKSEFR